MKKAEKLLNYIENSNLVDSIDEEIEKLENEIDRVERCMEIDESVEELLCGKANDLNQKLLMLKLIRNGYEKEILEFQLESYEED